VNTTEKPIGLPPCRACGKAARVVSPDEQLYAGRERVWLVGCFNILCPNWPSAPGSIGATREDAEAKESEENAQ